MPLTTADDGAPLSWTSWGSGPDVLLLPALCLGLQTWLPQAPLLARSARLHAVDPPGVGGSRPWRGERSVEQHADDAVRVLDAAGLDRVHVLAMSFGTVVAQRLLVRHPDRFRRAVLLGAPVGHRPGRRALLDRLDAAPSLGAFWQELAPWLVGPRLAVDAGLVLEALGRLAPALLTTDLPTARAEVRALMAVSDTPDEDLRGVRTPVLLVQGARDRLAPPGDTARLLELLPDARALVLPRCGHLVQTRVRTVDRAVREFLALDRPPAEQPVAPAA